MKVAKTQTIISNMLGLITIGIAYLIARKLDKAGDYKEPKGKYRNRYN